jgi:hypothetical protein
MDMTVGPSARGKAEREAKEGEGGARFQSSLEEYTSFHDIPDNQRKRRRDKNHEGRR